jgi:hypothetical protein
MCKTVYVCSPSYRLLCPLHTVLFDAYFTQKIFVKSISKYFSHYNLLFIIIQIHMHNNPTTSTTIYIKLWHHSLITVLKLKEVHFHLTNDFSDINFFNKRYLFIYLQYIPDYIWSFFSLTHSLSLSLTHTHTHMHTHTQILQHEKHGLAFIFCWKYFISKFLDHEILKWQNLEHICYIAFKCYDLQEGQKIKWFFY